MMKAVMGKVMNNPIPRNVASARFKSSARKVINIRFPLRPRVSTILVVYPSWN